MNLSILTLFQAKEKLHKKEITSRELVQACLDNIKKHNPTLNAFITVTEEQALQKAEEVDKKGTYQGLLEGIPVAIKDIICTKNIRTTAGSKILEHFVPPYNATVINNIEKAGGIIIGKTNLDEFAMGSSNENSAYGAVKNPWDTECVPGGSSGGSSAAVSAQMCFASLGTDTGGSIRQPASLCGVVGVKPTYGRVSRFGTMALASSLDQIGPLTRTVQDAAMLMEVLAGKDSYDATTLPADVPSYTQKLTGDIKHITIGIPQEYYEEGLAEEDRKVIEQAIELLKQKGIKIKEISLPYTKYALPVYYIILPCEASANLARYDGIRYCTAPDEKDIQTLEDIYMQTKKLFGPEPKRRIMLGTFALSAGYQDKYYLQAQKVRTLIKQDFDRAFQEVDVIVTPTSPSTAWKIGEKSNDPLQMYLSDIYTIPANLAGICGLSLPIGFCHNLPVGLQILGNQLQEETILNVAYALDQEIEFYKNTPPILA